MLNPVRMRIIQILAVKRNMTATEICEILSDIPRTTLYRHIAILLDSNIIAVISEQKIRGSLERTLAINMENIVNQNKLENALQNVYVFLIKKYMIFQKYFANEKPDTARDRVFFNNTILMATDEEFDHFLSDLKGLLIKYNFEFSPGRKARDISIISAPEER